MHVVVNVDVAVVLGREGDTENACQRVDTASDSVAMHYGAWLRASSVRADPADIVFHSSPVTFTVGFVTIAVGDSS